MKKLSLSLAVMGAVLVVSAGANQFDATSQNMKEDEKVVTGYRNSLGYFNIIKEEGILPNHGFLGFDFFGKTKENQKSVPTGEFNSIVSKDDAIEVTYSLVDEELSFIGEPVLNVYSSDGKKVVATTKAKVGENIKYTFKGLTPNTEYILKIEGTHQNSSDSLETIVQKVVKTTSSEKVKPEAEIIDAIETVDTVELNYSVSDEELAFVDQPQLNIYNKDGKNIVYSTKAKIGENNKYRFNGLSDDTEYIVRIEGEYDLNPQDNTVETKKEIIAEKTIKTEKLDLAKPTASITSTPFDSEVEITYSLEDKDMTLMENAKLNIYKSNGVDLVASTTAKTGVDNKFRFKGLTEGTNYVVKIQGKYDTDSDGQPNNTEPFTIAEETVNTSKPDKVVPTADIKMEESIIEKESIDVKFSLEDTDVALIDGATINLLKGEELVSSQKITSEDENHVFTGLEKGTDYIVTIEGLYDINYDQTPENQENPILTSDTFTSKDDFKVPTGEIKKEDDQENPTVVLENELIVTYDLIDNSNAIIGEPYMVLYENQTNDVVQTVDAEVMKNGVYSFTGLEDFKEYRVELVASYDNNEDGEVDIVDDALDTEWFMTKEHIVPVETHVIKSCKDLESIGRSGSYYGASHTDEWKLDENYVLESDIDCSDSISDEYGDDGFDTIGSTYHGGAVFTGIFDGNGYSVDGIYIESVDYSQGMFVRNDGVIQDLNYQIEIADFDDVNGEVGGLVGANGITGVISNVHGDVNIDSKAVYTGGVAGDNQGIITGSSTKGNVGGESSGGIAGMNTTRFGGSASITDSYSHANILAHSKGHAGGIAGINESGVLKNVYTTGNVGDNLSGIMAAETFGGIVGFDSFGLIENAYSTGHVNGPGEKSNGGIIGLAKDSEIAYTYSTGISYGGGLIGTAQTKTRIRNSVSIGQSRDGILGQEDYYGAVTDTYDYTESPCLDECSGYSKPITDKEITSQSWLQVVLGFDEYWNTDNVQKKQRPFLMKSDMSEELKGQVPLQK